MCATEWAKLCGRHTTAQIIDRFPHTSCLLHSSTTSHHHHGNHTPQTDRTAPNSARLSHTTSAQSPRRPLASPQGSPPAPTRRAFRACSEPNLQSRNSIQLQLEQIQHLQPAIRRRPSWIRRKLSRALGASILGSLRPYNNGDKLLYASSPSLHGLGNRYVCIGPWQIENSIIREIWSENFQEAKPTDFRADPGRTDQLGAVEIPTRDQSNGGLWPNLASVPVIKTPHLGFLAIGTRRAEPKKVYHSARPRNDSPEHCPGGPLYNHIVNRQTSEVRSVERPSEQAAPSTVPCSLNMETAAFTCGWCKVCVSCV